MAIQEARHSTESVEYIIRQQEKVPMPSLPTVVQPCKLVVATIGAEPEPLEILCFHPDMANASLSEADYFDFHHQELTTALSRQFPFLPPDCGETIASQLIGILRSANASHRCHGGALSAVHMVEVEVQPLLLPKLRPAAMESIYELIVKRESEADDNDHQFKSGVDECVICTEEIETRRSALSMPCSHVFHEICLVRWLNTSHVCPLCRYELPSGDRSIDLAQPRRRGFLFESCTC